MNVDFWFDPICPYTWMTAQWVREVAHVRNISLQFHVASLFILNENNDNLDDYHKKRVAQSLGLVRVCIAVEQLHGSDMLAKLYVAMATRIHNDEQEPDVALIRASLCDVGLPTELASAAGDASLDVALKRSHRLGMDALRDEIGVPIIRFARTDGQSVSFFGPVLIPAPHGEDAGVLWDDFTRFAQHEEFFELKRGRTRDPEFL